MVSDIEKQELATTYACLILHDDKADVNEDSINSLLQAANCTVEPYWPKLFADFLSGRDIDDLLLSAGAAGPGAGPAADAAAAGDAAAPAEEAAPVEESEEEEEDVCCAASQSTDPQLTNLCQCVDGLRPLRLSCQSPLLALFAASINLFDKHPWRLVRDNSIPFSDIRCSSQNRIGLAFSTGHLYHLPFSIADVPNLHHFVSTFLSQQC